MPTARAASAITTGAMGSTRSLAPFLGLRFIAGTASAIVLVLASALVLERLSVSRRGGLSTLHFAAVGAGIVISALLTWGIESRGGDWRWMWFGGGLVSPAPFIAVATLVLGTRGAPAPAVATMAVASKFGPWPLVVAYGLFGFGYVITAPFIVDIVRLTGNAHRRTPRPACRRYLGHPFGHRLVDDRTAVRDAPGLHDRLPRRSDRGRFKRRPG